MPLAWQICLFASILPTLNDRAMIRQICSIKPEDVARVRSELLAKLELEDLNLILREGFAGLGKWNVLVVQSEQHVIYRLMAGGDREAQANMEETDTKRLPRVEAHES